MALRIGKIFDPTIVMYLIIRDSMIKKYVDLMKVRPTEKFHEMVREQVLAYAVEGKEPPPEIATAIMNIADDVMAGRDAVMRAGDYIALVSYGRSKRIV
jgi:hypothetical protein